MRTARVATALLLAAVVGGGASDADAAPSSVYGLLEVAHTPAGTRLVYRVPQHDAPLIALEPALPEACAPAELVRSVEGYTALTRIYRLPCAVDALAGAEVGLRGPEPAGIELELLLRIRGPGGAVFSDLLTRGRRTVVVPVPGSGGASGWIGEGLLAWTHGVGPAALVLALLLLANGARKRWAVFGALAGALTLGLGVAASTGIGTGLAAVGASVGLAALFAAVERARVDAGRALESWTGRSPWLLALAAGPLAGAALSGPLADLGQPAAPALLGFWLGALGGMGARAMALTALERLAGDRGAAPFARVATFVVGSAAAFTVISGVYAVVA
jgi:hypothetical protein